MSYQKYFNFTVEPFSNSPMAQFYFNDPSHAKAMRKLGYALEQGKGLAVCMGPIGTGKTTLSRRLFNTLSNEKYQTALLVIVDSAVSSEWLMRRMAIQLGVKKPAVDKMALLAQLYRRLMGIYKEGRKTVVIIDEAQLLKEREIWEDFRGLLNLEVPGKKLINFVLFGMPELSQSLHIDEPLRQRVAVRCNLEPLSEATTLQYIAHRLKVAGIENTLFAEDVMKAIHKASCGVPRVINTVADNALFETALAKETQVSLTTVEQVAEELGLLVEEEAPDDVHSSEDEQAASDAEKSGTDVLETFDRILAEMDEY